MEKISCMICESSNTDTMSGGIKCRNCFTKFRKEEDELVLGWK